jgi:hypothetical protein
MVVAVMVLAWPEPRRCKERRDTAKEIMKVVVVVVAAAGYTRHISKVNVLRKKPFKSHR